MIGKGKGRVQRQRCWGAFMDSTAGIGVLGRGATGLEGQAEKTPQEVPTTRREEDALSAG